MTSKLETLENENKNLVHIVKEMEAKFVSFEKNWKKSNSKIKALEKQVAEFKAALYSESEEEGYENDQNADDDKSRVEGFD